MKNEKGIRVAERAREIMAERGKCEGQFVNGKGKVCLRGALYMAQAEIDGLEWQQLIFDFTTTAEAVVWEAAALLREEGVMYPGSADHVARWNDGYDYHGNRVTPPSSEDVQLLLKRVAGRLREAA